MTEGSGAAQQHRAQLERRWAAAAASRHVQLESLVLRTAAVLATVHYSRSLARRCGWAPWRALLQQARAMGAAALALCARHRAARALEAWRRCQQAATWRAVAAEACAVAAARRHHQRALLAHGLAALAEHARWARQLLHRHDVNVAAGALRCWRAAAAEAAACTRQLEAMAIEHWARAAARRALAAWQHGVVRCRQERLVAQRRELRWGAAQQYLAEHRAAKQATAAAAAVSGGGGDGGSDCGPGGGPQHSLSSAENSFDPNTIFYGAHPATRLNG